MTRQATDLAENDSGRSISTHLGELDTIMQPTGKATPSHPELPNMRFAGVGPDRFIAEMKLEITTVSSPKALKKARQSEPPS